MSQRLIVTHNNADFDAIASLLAMHRLDPTAIPVLPARTHRNVQDFLSLYASLLRGVVLDDLDEVEALEYVYVVDTQKRPTLPGLLPSTKVYIVDHHPPTQKLPRNYEFWGEELGATTTLLTERIQREDILLSSLEASLLMLGIYEDTGSLAYETTTPRDIRAAAWLLTQGAKLEIVRNFLSHSLEDDQWILYDRLRESATIVEIEGHSILIAIAEMPKQLTGIAAIAHQIANLYDPSALVLLVQMGQDVQMVGRSSVEAIDVGEVARKLGGGGHGRAAAALVHHTTIPDIVTRLMGLLHEIVQPSVTVADLMSTGQIETVADTDTIDDANREMQVSGHEGYPVIEGERVVGLLTRRAVDRAINHNLGHQHVTQIMEAGTNIYVRPSDSLEALRQKIIDTGWGQLPVLDDSNTMIGIVTRTDLIRRWGEGPRDSRRQRLLLQQLQETLPDGLWPLIKTISHEAQAQQLDLYLVGGLVRDLLLDVPNLDIDFVVEGEAIPFVQHLCAKYGGDMRYHYQFGTAKWLLDADLAARMDLAYSDEWPSFIDFATARAEFYKEPTALPTVRQSSIKQDLHRRDFTINSLAIRLAPEPMGDLIDYYNGERDLNHKIIRVLHSLSFVDDPTRIIRAVRFEQRLGFHIEERTAGLLQDALSFLDRVTGERIRNELAHILREPDPLRALRRLDQTGILHRIHSALYVDAWFEAAYRAIIYFRHNPIWPIAPNFGKWPLSIFALLTVRLSKEMLDSVGKRLQVSRAQMKLLHMVQDGYCQILAFTPDMYPSTVVEILEPLDEMCWLALWAAAPTAVIRQIIEQFVTEWRHVQSTYDGRRLREMGMKPGPAMGQMLRDIRRAWLDGIVSTSQQEDDFVQRMLDELA